MKKSHKRKGFTLTELAIVIAVIAILIAVLVPTFISLINSANKSSDEQTVTNLNTALAIDEADGSSPETLCGVWLVLEEASYNPAPTPNYSDNHFYWYKTENRVVIYSEADDEITFPADYTSVTLNDDEFIELDDTSAAAHDENYAIGLECSVCGSQIAAASTDDMSLSDDGKTLYAYTGSETVLVIPDGITTIGTEGTTAEPDNAISTTIEAVYIPSSVTTISSSAFYGCTALTTVTFAEGSTCTTIGYYAFYGCTSLESIEIPDSVTTLNSNTFQYCSSLETAIIGSGVTSIGDRSFDECSALTSVTLKGEVTSIGEFAFNECTALTEIDLPDSLTSIGQKAFYKCSSLKEIAIPGNVSTITDNCFYGCTALESVTIGSGVTSIATNAFDSCSALTAITIPSSVTSIGSYAFYSCSNLASVTFEDITSTWTGKPFIGSTTVSITVSTDTSTNATYLTSEESGGYCDYSWAKNS